MAKFVHYEPCPACRARGKDRRGDNLGRYSDGGGHCYSCGYHEQPTLLNRNANQTPVKNVQEGPLPRDFTRDVPADGWKWLLQYGLPYSYWKPYCGYSPASERLVITHGSPVEYSVGRWIGTDGGNRVQQLHEGRESHSKLMGGAVRRHEVVSHEEHREAPRKWRAWGERLRTATILEPTDSSSTEIVLVEDLVSAHKVRQAGYSCLPIFGSDLYPLAIKVLRATRKPVALWLDLDQWGSLPKKLNRLQTFLDAPVRFIKTDKDPKEYSLSEIKEIING
jgi:hypothetical protein